MRNEKGQFMKGNKKSENAYKFPKGHKRLNSLFWNKGTNLSGMKGKKHTEETKEKMSKKARGEGSHFWKGGISPITWRLRHCSKYSEWRLRVFERDQFVCQDCKQNSNKLNAHHIKDFSIILKEKNIKTFEDGFDCAELWEINNGITLCEKCHGKTKGFRRYK
jgi:hypothetical protein